jgi:hypothetical protein
MTLSMCDETTPDEIARRKIKAYVYLKDKVATKNIILDFCYG